MGGIGFAFAIVLKGIDWQLNVAVKTAAFAFLIAWAVFCFVLYISNYWDKRRPLMIVAQIVVGLGLIGVWVAYLPSPPPPVAVTRSPSPIPTVDDAKETYPFREKSQETVTFVFGHNFIRERKDLLSSQPQDIALQSLIGPPSYNSVSIYLKNGKPLVDVKMWGDGDPDGKGATYLVEVSQNEFVVRPSAWDRNFNDRAFEVVDESGTPMLQIYYRRADEIVINGVFRTRGVMTYASEDKGVFGLLDKQPPPPPLRRMFRYPAMQHTGEFAPEWKPYVEPTNSNNDNLDPAKPVIR